MTFCNDFIKRGELSNDPANAKPVTPVVVVQVEVVRTEEQVDSVVMVARVKASTPQVEESTNVVRGSAIVIASGRNEDAVCVGG